MGGPFGGTIYTSQGLQAVAPDGTFWVPQSDVPAMLRAGAFFTQPGLASVRIGGYVIYEDNTSGDLLVSEPSGSSVPLIGATGEIVTNVITVPGSTFNLASTQQLNIFRQDVPSALSLYLPTHPPVNLQVGVKDGGNNFALHNAIVFTVDGTMIDIVPGADGFGMNVLGEEAWFIFDGVQWNASWTR